jgi:putative membrane protein
LSCCTGNDPVCAGFAAQNRKSEHAPSLQIIFRHLIAERPLMLAEPDDLEVRAADTLALQSNFERREISWHVSAFQAITSAESAVPQIWPVRNMSTDPGNSCARSRIAVLDPFGGEAYIVSYPPAERPPAMRWVYLTVIFLFVAATLLFAIQNFQIVTMSFLGLNARAPLALLVAAFYVLGMVTGGSLLALLRRSLQGSRRTIR